MVYEGKPSQGCGTCRKRRIKCDQARPVCGQCIKSKRECLGYRDQSELMFVSENRSLKAKAAGNKGKRIAISRSAHSTSDSDEASRSSSVSRSLTENTERQALTYFFSEFVSIPRHQEACRGYMDYLLPIYSDARKNSPLFDATASAALASYSRKRGASKLMLQSHIYYGRAVTALQDAINDPTLARSNETLMSIMMLGLFETMVASENTLYEWGHHADGAAALVGYRGEEMFNDSLSRKLYWAVKSQAVINNVIKAEPLEPFKDWENLWKLEIVIPNENHAIKLTTLCTRIPALRAAGMKWLQAPMSGECALKVIELMGHAKVLDQLLSGWAFGTPSSWKPRVVGTAEGDVGNPHDTEVWPGKLESYYDLWVAAIWNQWRSMRIVLQCIVVNCCERLFPAARLRQVPEYQQAANVVAAMVDAVCASVPYHLGHPMPAFDEWESVLAERMEDVTRDDADLPKHRPDPNNKDRSVKALGAYYLMWPMYIACSAITISGMQRQWIQGRLLHIGKLYAAGQANVLANLHTYAPNVREDTLNDYCPPPFEPYPELGTILRSRGFRNVEAIADLQATTAEAKLYRRWREDFLRRLTAL